MKTCGWLFRASILCGAILAGSGLKAADIATTETVAATQPADLPGLGLAQHPFLYTGEWDHRNTTQTIFLVRGGKVVWTYQVPTKDSSGTMEELGDATLLSNGNVIFCRKVGASEVTPEKKIVWDIEAPKGTEIHSVQPIGLDHVLIVENGNPAKLMLINTTTGGTEKETDLPTAHPKSPHLQFRRVRQLGAGSILAASNWITTRLWNMTLMERRSGRLLPSPWSAERLANGDTLIGCSSQECARWMRRGRPYGNSGRRMLRRSSCSSFRMCIDWGTGTRSCATGARRACGIRRIGQRRCRCWRSRRRRRLFGR